MNFARPYMVRIGFIIILEQIPLCQKWRRIGQKKKKKVPTIITPKRKACRNIGFSSVFYYKDFSKFQNNLKKI